ncbi:MAG TPA: Tim44-like domain-containing protein [Agitococcus sp.]|nr:Tim44-like domain-containing protein [Agitococcus sp.]HNJ86893.1 Tim44-like domain-containing protein [Agitococcus sp.]HNL79680.1 Tim44-like domain-containing protein [Agitococcus sp.]HNN29635.1 Tim44-like domain-containing protein [Agitococcus sp.]HNP02649.1 Tim44-like domain-containing protein [Agitococcus sp.]
MKKPLIFACFTLVLMGLFVVEPAFAGPGGMIAKAVVKSFWAKVIIGLLVLFFLPLICYTLIREWLAGRRSLKDLRFMAKHHKAFDWLTLRQRIQDCFFRIHAAWQQEDVTTASQWMSDWYWQNQQFAHLNRWQQQNLTNICEIKALKSIKPLLFTHRNEGSAHENSILVVLITANMMDYLKQRDTGVIVEGSADYQDVERVWTFIFQQGAWKVSMIEESSTSLEYANMIKQLPAIETTLLSPINK